MMRLMPWLCVADPFVLPRLNSRKPPVRTRTLRDPSLTLVLCTSLTLVLVACGTEPEDVTDDESELGADAGTSGTGDRFEEPDFDASSGSDCVFQALLPIGDEPACDPGCWPVYTQAVYGCLPDSLAQGAPAFVGCAPNDTYVGGVGADAHAFRAKFPGGFGVTLDAAYDPALEALGGLERGSEAWQVADEMYDNCRGSAD